MKLNEKGMEIYNVWERKYHEELERIRRETNNPFYEEGWCIIDHPESLEDETGILIFGYDDNAIYHIIECVEFGCFSSPDEEWMFGKSCREMVELLKPYFDIGADEKLPWDDDKQASKTEYSDFVDDDDKMWDFFTLNKDEFLESYSYLTETEYRLTLLRVLEILHEHKIG